MLEIKLYCIVAAAPVRRGLQFQRRGWGCSAAHDTAGRLSLLVGIQFLIRDYTADAYNPLVQPFGPLARDIAAEFQRGRRWTNGLAAHDSAVRRG